jgi:hypothetical protein
MMAVAAANAARVNARSTREIVVLVRWCAM